MTSTEIVGENALLAMEKELPRALFDAVAAGPCTMVRVSCNLEQQMGRMIWVLGLLLMLGCAAQPAKVDKSKVSVTTVNPLLVMDEATRRVQAKDWLGADRLMERAIESPSFDQLPESERYKALRQAADIASDLGENGRARRLLARAGAFPQATYEDWHQRLAAAYAVKDYADSARCVVTIATRWPQTLELIRAQAIHQIAYRLKGEASANALHFELLDSLFSAEWLSDGTQPSGLWVDLAALLLERGNTERAVSVAALIDSARSVLALRIDRRFDSITRAVPQRFDVAAVARAEVAAARVKALESASLLEPRVRLQALLLGELQFDQALTIADDVIATVGQGDGAKAYEDFADEYAWILDQRSIALQRLGRWDEAVLQLRRAARRPEQGELNVSQALNLGLLYAELGRSAEALDAVTDLGALNAYGRMQLERVRLMAAVQLGDHAAMEARLDYLRQHRADAMSTYQTVLLDAGRADEAAAFLVERLRSDLWRSEALLDMQTYAAVVQPQWVRDRTLLWRRVIARADVQQELAEVGRIEDVPLAPPGS